MIYLNDIFHFLFLLFEPKENHLAHTEWLVADGWHAHTTHQINECAMSKRWICFTISNLMVFNLFLNRLFEIQNSVNTFLQGVGVQYRLCVASIHFIWLRGSIVIAAWIWFATEIDFSNCDLKCVAAHQNSFWIWIKWMNENDDNNN